MKAWQGGERAWRRDVEDEAAVQRLAAEFARSVEPPAVIYLRGDLGAGKTTFARAYIHALGYEGYVKSPSYGLLETYAVPGLSVLHLDLYRIEDPEELEYLAIRDQFDERTVLLVEWPDRGAGFLPQPDLVLDFGEKDAMRFIACSACTPAGRALAAEVTQSDS
ncbi:MAG TPA: tRNA (adenosine(37)-N6)-threonylcarbamoyltransferase complex ATPase subunit type 1 TsaE [Xanthomonadales bacterium]|nr:tRNA (adenosine(37)-N6)-threonylcarbamoyltransferase complex ATPase subunit type 1 TsaE [Xanthomonadales bacterium]